MAERADLQAAGAWLATGAILFVFVFGIHGPLHPDLEVQMTRIAASPSRWSVAHWTASASLSVWPWQHSSFS